MAERFVRTDEFGFAVPPRVLDCIGVDCRYYQNGGCYPSGHHLYFEEEYYRSHSELAWEFRNDPSNIVTMARCREDRIHAMYDGARAPTPYMMECFLRESAILQDLGVVTKKLVSCDRSYGKKVQIADSIDGLGRPDISLQYHVSAYRTAGHMQRYARERSRLKTSLQLDVFPERLLDAQGLRGLLV